MNPVTMLPDLAADRQRTLIAEAATYRSQRTTSPAGSLRRALGTRLVRLGESLAGAPSAEPVNAATTAARA